MTVLMVVSYFNSIKVRLKHTVRGPIDDFRDISIP